MVLNLFLKQKNKRQKNCIEKEITLVCIKEDKARGIYR